MIVTKNGDYVYVKVDKLKAETFKKVVKGAIWDGYNKCWKVPATISTFKNLRAFQPGAMEPDILTPAIRKWYDELLARAKRIDELQRGVPDAPTLDGVNEGTRIRSVSGDGPPTGRTTNIRDGTTTGGSSNGACDTRVELHNPRGESEGQPTGRILNTGDTDGETTNGCESSVSSAEDSRVLHTGVRFNEGYTRSECNEGRISGVDEVYSSGSGGTDAGDDDRLPWEIDDDARRVTSNTRLSKGVHSEAKGDAGGHDAIPNSRLPEGDTSGARDTRGVPRGECSGTETDVGGKGPAEGPDEGHTTAGVLCTLPTDLRRGESGLGPQPVVFPDGFRFPYAQPFKHQREAIAFCVNLKKAALWLDLGLGKTFTSINVARFRHQFNGVTRVLVVAPRSLLHQWVGELASFSPESTAFVVEGTPVKKRSILQAVRTSKGLTFVMITYESIGALRGQLSEAGFGMFILDESTKIKNPKASRSRAVVEVCKDIEYGVELTGLAYLNNPIDLFSQFLALDTTVFGTDAWLFSERYIDFVKAPFGRVMRGLRHLDELKRRAYFIAFSRTKKECLDLPEKMYQVRKLPMYPEQAEWYLKLSDEALATSPEVLTSVNVANVLTKLEKLQQVTAGFLIQDSGEVIWFDSPKYKETCEIIVDSTASFIIWVRHAEATKRVADALLAYNIVSEQLNRYTSSHRRTQGIKQFREGKLRVLICQLTSESKGLNLTCATNSVNSIYLENNFSIDDRFQSESRQHRIGMGGAATYIDLVLEDTIDETILDVLKGKYEISSYIATHGLNMVLGKGGSVAKRKSRSKKALPKPEDFKEDPITDWEGVEGFEDLVDISRRKKT